MSEEGKGGWRDLPLGGLILEAGNAERYPTGDWRTLRPVIDLEKCTHCMLCWFFCPDSAILVSGGKVVGADLTHCKGCGICAVVCPVKIQAIGMVEEAQARSAREAAAGVGTGRP
jgi:2-oxoacid:acceptor oxidoreductase delta subunit (pyruvate/2-ketoisovalerate family)